MATSFERADAARASIADLLDQQLLPLGLDAIDELAIKPGQAIVDVGCGTGATVAQLADRVGQDGRVIGIDIGPQSLAVARARLQDRPSVTLIEQDAANVDMPAQSLDAVYSRFGVMFFDDPVAAFARFRTWLRPSGRIAFVCWRPLQDNELDLLPLQAAAPDSEIDQTPFSFARADDIQYVLDRAGWQDINICKRDTPVSCGGLEETLKVLTTVGPLGKILRDTPTLRAAAEPHVRDALRRHAGDNPNITLNAATWLASAVAR